MPRADVTIPNIQMTRKQRCTAIANYRKRNKWASDYEPDQLLDANPGMSVQEAFEQLKAETEREQAIKEEHDRRNARHVATRLYGTRYSSLDEMERIQLRVLLENAGRRDVADALIDNISCSAQSMINHLDNGEQDRDPETDWLTILPIRVKPDTDTGHVGQFLADLRSHRRKWRMWGRYPTPSGADREAQMLRQQAGPGFDVHTVTYRADGTTGVFARRP